MNLSNCCIIFTLINNNKWIKHVYITKRYNFELLIIEYKNNFFQLN